MNKDKMKLEEAIKVLQKTVESNNEVIKEARKNGDINVMQLTADLDNQSIAIETVLQALENSIPIKKIEDKIEELENCKMDIVQSPVHNVNEKMKILDRNMIKREALQELLEDK